jgi:hypothetical protein
MHTGCLPVLAYLVYTLLEEKLFGDGLFSCSMSAYG